MKLGWSWSFTPARLQGWSCEGWFVRLSGQCSKGDRGQFHWEAVGLFRYTGGRMNIDQTIREIESLERLFAVPDTRPLSASDISAANRRHDEKLAHSPWFQLWLRYGICCRPEPPSLQLGEIES